MNSSAFHYPVRDAANFIDVRMRSTMKRHRLAVCAVLALAAGCQPSASENSSSTTAVQDVAMKVTPIKPERKTLTRRSEQPGEIEAFETAPLWAKVTGYVRVVHVDIGDRVVGPKRDAKGMVIEPGQLLAEIEIPELAEDLKQRQAIVKQGVAAVKVAEAAHKSADALVAEAQAAVDRAEATYRRWETEYERVRMLAASNAVTQKVADETEQQFKSADAARRETAAKIKSAMAKLAESAAGIEKANADLLVAQAEADKAQAVWNYTQIRAPFDGIVGARQIDPGHLVTSNATGSKPLFTVVAADTVRLCADVPESDAAAVQLEREAKVKVGALGGAVLEGKVTRTSWVLHAGARTLRIQVDLPNPDGRLRPGMSAQVDLLIAQRADVWSLPKSAIGTADGQSFVLRVGSDKKLVKQLIKTCLKAGADVEVTEGLTGDELLVGTNLASYREGELVEVPE